MRFDSAQLRSKGSQQPQSQPSAFVPLKVGSLLRPEQGAQRWHLGLNPYEGCAFGCTHCSARLERKDLSSWRAFERRIGVKTNAVEALVRDLKNEDFAGRRIVLGTQSDPWQPAEEKFRVTRALLERLATYEGLELHVNTRSSLIARDTDLLSRIARNSHVTIAIAVPSLDERINRLMEPQAPSALRRLSALDALGRAGLCVGIVLSPVFMGLDPAELGLEPLLTRASHLGARFAGLQLLKFAAGQRETFLAHVTEAYPELAVRFRRVVGVKPPSDEDKRALIETFRSACERLGLEMLSDVLERKPMPALANPGAEQLTLF